MSTKELPSEMKAPNEKIDSSSQTTIENEIFKSLSHQIRRDIIKALGEKREMSFTEIKNAAKIPDTPSLSYHLKSLKYLLDQKNETYFLTDMGQTALLLMDKIDQSDRLKTWKRNMLKANIVTQISWILILIFIPYFISNYNSVETIIWITILLNILAQFNFQVIWRLYGKSAYNPGKKSKKPI